VRCTVAPRIPNITLPCPPYNHPKLIVSRLAIPSIATAGVNGMPFGFLLRDILNKDVPRQEPRQHFGRAIVNKALVLYVSILSLSSDRLPHSGLDGDTHAGSQAFGSCANRNTLIGTRVPRTVLTFDIPRLRASPVGDAQESLRALQESADALQNPHLKRVVRGVSALLQTAEVEQCVGFLYEGVCFTKFCSAWNRKRKPGRSAHSKR
jgi:hypothetical protein